MKFLQLVLLSVAEYHVLATSAAAKPPVIFINPKNSPHSHFILRHDGGESPRTTGGAIEE